MAGSLEAARLILVNAVERLPEVAAFFFNALLTVERRLRCLQKNQPTTNPLTAC